jgi:hypothetical protein
MFEFQGDMRGVIRGKVDKDIPTAELSNYNRDWVNQRSIATVVVRKVLRRGQTVRESFTLKRLARSGDTTPGPEARA